MASLADNPFIAPLLEILGANRAAPPITVPVSPRPVNYNTVPQRGNEPNIVFDARRLFEAPMDAAGRTVQRLTGAGQAVQQDVSSGVHDLFSTPNSRAARQKPISPQSPFPTSFADPVYAQADQNAAQITGVPAALINAIRLRGERTNAGVTSVAGANTPYQITEKTRQGIINKYKIDPWSNPTNAALGAAYVLREQAGNPGPQDWDQTRAVRAIGGYFGGKAGADNPFSTGISDANGQTVGGYTQQVLGGKTPLPASFLNPYDPTYDKMAMGELGAERKALLTPQTFTIDRGPAPELPKPQPIPQTDFTQAQESLNRMRPVEMSAKEKLQRERDGFFSGIAQAMMKSPGNEGLGTFLMRLGGAALGGREGARDEIRAEADKFDEKMAQYQAAVFQENMVEARTRAQEAQAQVAQNNQYNTDNWKTAYQRWLGNGSIDISGTNAVITSTDDNGQTTVRTVPIQSAVDAAVAKQSADLFQSMGGRQFAGNQQITGMTNALIGRQAIMDMSGSGSAGQAQKDAAAAAAPAFYGTFIAQHGLIGDLLGSDAAKSLEDSVQKQLLQANIIPGSKEYIDRRDQLVATEIAKLGLANPDIMKKMMQVGAVAGSFQANDALMGAKTRTATDEKGRTSTSTTMSAADIFAPPSQTLNDGTDLNAYGYSRY